MPRLLNAYLDPAQVPSRVDLQAAIRRLGFKLVVEDAYVPHEASGYVPCTLEGEDAGVYLRFERDASLPDNAAALAGQQGPRRELLQLRWGGDAREHLTACVWAVALAQDFDALLIDPDSGAQADTAALLKKARQLRDENF
jgi:phosphatidylserine/phosphatidylglycerophosphate/cardiolipin synthase-like enzyme